jgi:uncharacterized protein YheU (UPF0270 family)
MEIAFQTGIGIVNATQGRMGNAFLLFNETHKGVSIHGARYLPPSMGEKEAMKSLPIRYNFSPSFAIVKDYLVLASTPDVLKELIDAQAGATPVRAGVNAGLWIRGSEAHRAVRENRENLIAQTMVKEGDDRATAERKIDLLLDAARHVRSLSLTSEESRAALGFRLEIVLRRPVDLEKDY